MMHLTKNPLISQFAQINAIPDAQERINAWTELLNHPELHIYFTKEDIGHIYYNRSLDRAELAEKYFSEGDASRANRMITYYANSDMKNAQMRYPQKFHKECEVRFKEYKILRNKYLAECAPHLSPLSIDEEPNEVFQMR